MKGPIAVFCTGLMFCIALLGCSGGVGPMEPGNGANTETLGANSHFSWGVFTFICEPDNGTIEIVPMRETTLHLNVLPFLEDPPNIYISIEQRSPAILCRDLL